MAFANDLRISLHTWPLLETEHWDATIEWSEDEEWPVCLDIFKDEVVLFFKEEEGWALVRRMDPKNIWDRLTPDGCQPIGLPRSALDLHAPPLNRKSRLMRLRR